MSLLGVGVTSPALDPIMLGLCATPDIYFYSVSCVLHLYSISLAFLMQCHNQRDTTKSGPSALP